MNMSEAERLAVCFHDHYERHLKRQNGQVINVVIPPFDRASPDGRAIIYALQELMATGELVVPETRGVVTLHAKPDGRRSRALYPNRLIGWQFMGQLDKHGKAYNAPDWVADKIRRGQSGFVDLKTSLSICPKLLLVGDWVVRDDTGIYAEHPRIFSLPAAVIARWYTVAA